MSEAGLAARGGEPAGSDAAANSETTSGTIAFTSPDGVQTVSLGGHLLTETPQTFSDATGSMTASYSYDAATGAGSIAYSYTLTDNTLTDPSNVSFAVAVTDKDGDSAPAGNLTIAIIDDAPVAHDDGAVVSTSAQTLTFDDVALADGMEQPLAPGYHSFNLTQTGVYNPGGGTYAPHSGENVAFIGEKNGQDIPGYAGNPGDPVTVRHVDGSNFTAIGAWFSSNASDPLTMTFSAYDDNNQLIGSFTQAIHTGPGGGPTYVDFSVFGSVDHLTFDSPGGANGAYFGFDDFSYADNSTATGNVITGVGTTSPATGADVVGADNAAITQIAGFAGATDATADSAGNFQVNGQYGALTVNENGSYAYVRFDGSPLTATDIFTYTLTDGDGDHSTATLSVAISDHGVAVGLPDAGSASVEVFEAGLAARNGEAAGSDAAANSETTTGTITYTAADGIGVILIDGVPAAVGQTYVHAGIGALTITSMAAGIIGYSYTLADNTSGDNASDSFAIKVVDSDGDSKTVTLAITIVDDAPVAHADTDAVAANQFTAEAGNVITGAGTTSAATGADVQGADGAVVAGVAAGNTGADLVNAGTVNASIHGSYGTLTLQADGSYSYVRDAGSAGGVSDAFTYTLERWRRRSVAHHANHRDRQFRADA